jgi:hypothetical protein
MAHMTGKNTPPFFVGIGAQRSGTSWLFSCLNEHPEIFMPRKEMHFFDNDYSKGIDWYCDQFINSKEIQKTGEFTPDYMSNIQALRRIADLSTEIKLIVILREPIERAYSATQLYKSHGQYMEENFSELLIKQPSFLAKSLYSSQIKDIYNLFPKENVLICLFDDIEKCPKSFFKNVCRFLSVEESFMPKIINTKKNISSMSSLQSVINLPRLQKKLLSTRAAPLIHSMKKSTTFAYIKNLIYRWSNSATNLNIYSELSYEIRQSVIEDIQKLEVETGLDLSTWRNKI